MSLGTTMPASAGNQAGESGQSNAVLIDAAPVLVIRVDYPAPEMLEPVPLEDLYETLDDTLPQAE